MSVAGRLARKTKSREPALVNQGPASTRPTRMRVKPASSSRSWPPGAARLAGRVEVREQGDASQEWDDPERSRRRRRRSTAHAERRDLDAAEREARGDDRGEGDPDDHQCDVAPGEREVTWRERCAGEGDEIEQRAKEEEQGEARLPRPRGLRPSPPPRRSPRSGAAWRRRAASPRSAALAWWRTTGSRSRSG